MRYNECTILYSSCNCSFGKIEDEIFHRSWRNSARNQYIYDEAPTRVGGTVWPTVRVRYAYVLSMLRPWTCVAVEHCGQLDFVRTQLHSVPVRGSAFFVLVFCVSIEQNFETRCFIDERRWRSAPDEPVCSSKRVRYYYWHNYLLTAVRSVGTRFLA